MTATITAVEITAAYVSDEYFRHIVEEIYGGVPEQESVLNKLRLIFERGVQTQYSHTTNQIKAVRGLTFTVQGMKLVRGYQHKP